MRLSARQIEPRGSVDRHNGSAVLRQALRQREHVALRGTGGPGAEQRIDGNGGLRPGFLATQLAHAVEPGERAIVDCVVGFGIERGDPDRNADCVQRAREHPAIAPVVARARGDQDAPPAPAPAPGECVRHLVNQYLRDGATRGLHQHATGHPILRPCRRIPRRRFARREHRNRIHGITTPA